MFDFSFFERHGPFFATFFHCLMRHLTLTFLPLPFTPGQQAEWKIPPFHSFLIHDPSFSSGALSDIFPKACVHPLYIITCLFLARNSPFSVVPAVSILFLPFYPDSSSYPYAPVPPPPPPPLFLMSKDISETPTDFVLSLTTVSRRPPPQALGVHPERISFFRNPLKTGPTGLYLPPSLPFYTPLLCFF